MMTSTECHERAAAALAREAESESLAHRAHWLEIARGWVKLGELARWQEEFEIAIKRLPPSADTHPAPPPPAGC